MSGRIVLVTGGARSGKSRHAETRTLQLGRPAIYIATAQADDDEMAARIVEHQRRRGPEWRTLAAPMDLPGAIAASDAEGLPRLVDCLTLWLTNLMLAEAPIEAETARLLDVLCMARAPVVLVTNEVGCGIVPDNALARRFRDAAGRLNQSVAAAAAEVTLVACGLPLTLKNDH